SGRVQWEYKADRKFENAEINRRVEDLLLEREKELETRQKKLKALLEKEQEELERELEDMKETPQQRQDRIIKQAEEILKEKEKRRQVLVTEKYKQLDELSNEDIRKKKSKETNRKVQEG